MGDSADTEVFANKSIQALIDFQYPHVKKWINFRLFLPFMFFHIIYIISNNVVEAKYKEDLEDSGLKLANMILSIILLVMSLYFLGIEAFQFKSQGFVYFTSGWNYIDITPPLMIFVYYIRLMID